MLAFIVAVVLLAQTAAFTAGLGPRRGRAPLGNDASAHTLLFCRSPVPLLALTSSFLLYPGLNFGGKEPSPRVPPLPSSSSSGDNGVGSSFGGGDGGGGDRGDNVNGNGNGNDGGDGMGGNGNEDGGDEGAGSPRGLALGSVFGRLFDEYNTALDKHPLLVKGKRKTV